MSLKILITGGTGFIGRVLISDLLDKGYQLFILTRSRDYQNQNNLTYINNLADIVFDFDIVINLAGEPIAKRWSLTNKKTIYESRINLTKDLVSLINNSSKKPKLLISGSAIGFYGNDNSQFDEDSNVQDLDIFSQKICRDWENEAEKVNDAVRLAKIRIGIVLGKNGGALAKMLPAFKLGLGGKMASGLQYMSWIHIDDLVAAINHIIENDKIDGVVNLTAPNPVKNKNFSQNLARILKRPCFFDMPNFAINIIFGEMGQELLSSGQKVLPKKLLQQNFTFKFADLDEALKDILL